MEEWMGARVEGKAVCGSVGVPYQRLLVSEPQAHMLSWLSVLA